MVKTAFSIISAGCNIHLFSTNVGSLPHDNSISCALIKVLWLVRLSMFYVSIIGQPDHLLCICTKFSIATDERNTEIMLEETENSGQQRN